MLAVLRAALLFVALATTSARAEPTTWVLIVGVGDTAEPRLGPVKNAPNALLAWLDEEVPRLTARHRGGPQNPVQASTGQDFPLIVAP